MALDDRTAQKQLTPEERRAHLRALADRMLLKAASLDDPEDMAGVEKTVRVTAGIERIYSRCDRAERQTLDPRKLEAERATNRSDAIKARVALASDLEWGEQRRRQLGKWWDAAQTDAHTPAQIPSQSPAVAPVVASQPSQPETPQFPAETLAAQGAALLKRLDAVSEKTLGKMETTRPQTASDVLATANYILKAFGSLKRADITADELEDLDEELNGWLQGRPPPS